MIASDSYLQKEESPRIFVEFLLVISTPLPVQSYFLGLAE